MLKLSNCIPFPAGLAAIMFSIFFTGCQPQISNPSAMRTIPQATFCDLSTPVGMSRHLENLPAVRSVEKWDNEYSPGIIITTKNYEIHTTMLEPLVLSRVPAFMESAYSAYQKQLPYPIKTQHKFTIYLFDNRSQWESFTRKFTGDNSELYLKIKKGAYYLNGACVTYNIGRSRTFSVLGHEGWHQFNSRHFTYRLPSWLDEGIATLFESSFYKDGFFYFDPSQNVSRLGSLRKRLKSGRIIPLDKLLRLNPGEIVAHADTETVMAFYAQSYALIRFLKEDKYGKHISGYQQMLFDGKEGNWPIEKNLQKSAADRNIPITANWNRNISPKLFEHYIDNCKHLQNEYIPFCKKLVRNVQIKTFSQKAY